MQKNNFLKVTFLFYFYTFNQAFSTDKNYPEIYFEYGSYDIICKTTNHYPITKELKDQLHQAIPIYQKVWNSKSAELFKKLNELFGKNFSRKELVATMILCHGVPPMSSPLMINMRPYLNGQGQDAATHTHFTYTMFHEMLHRFLVENYQHLYNSSPLIKKYKENCGLQNCARVLSHLHLMAIIKAIYLGLDKKQELDQIIQSDSDISNPGYRRSWEIVNSEGYETFVKELHFL